MQKSKERTSRVSLWRELSIPNVFTMEASFCGSEKSEFAGYHFTSSQYMQIGRDLCRSLIYCFELKSGLLPMPSSGSMPPSKYVMGSPDKKILYAF